MKKFFSIFIFTSMLFLITFGTAVAQSAGELQLGMSRDWGMAGFGNDIQGLFTLKIKDPPANLSKVVFLLDGNPMGEDSQAPFAFQYNTDSYPLGLHSLSATGYSTDGQEYKSNTLEAKFVPASAANDLMLKLLVPLLGLVVLIIVISAVLPQLLNKGKLSTVAPGTARKYGIGGGTVCPNCNHPFPLRFWWINLGTMKIDRCPYCGRFGFFHPRTKADLRAAELAEVTSARPESTPAGETEAEKLQKELDRSKYQDL